jgi:hypothetical protein
MPIFPSCLSVEPLVAMMIAIAAHLIVFAQIRRCRRRQHHNKLVDTVSRPWSDSGGAAKIMPNQSTPSIDLLVLLHDRMVWYGQQ